MGQPIQQAHQQWELPYICKSSNIVRNGDKKDDLPGHDALFPSLSNGETKMISMLPVSGSSFILMKEGIVKYPLVAIVAWTHPDEEFYHLYPESQKEGASRLQFDYLIQKPSEDFPHHHVLCTIRQIGVVLHHIEVIGSTTPEQDATIIADMTRQVKASEEKFIADLAELGVETHVSKEVLTAPYPAMRIDALLKILKGLGVSLEQLKERHDRMRGGWRDSFPDADDDQ